MSDQLLIYAIKPEDQTFVAIRKKSDNHDDNEPFDLALCDCPNDSMFVIVPDHEHYYVGKVFDAYKVQPIEAEGEIERIAREMLDEAEILLAQNLGESKALTDLVVALLELIGDIVSSKIILKIPPHPQIGPGDEIDWFRVDAKGKANFRCTSVVDDDGTLKPKK